MRKSTVKHKPDSAELAAAKAKVSRGIELKNQMAKARDEMPPVHQPAATEQPRCPKCLHLQSKNVNDRCSVWACCCACVFPAEPAQSVTAPQAEGLAPWDREPYPCWSCGGDAEARDDIHVRCIDTKNVNCEVMGHWFTRKAWNTRATPPATPRRTRRDPQFRLDAWPLPDVLSQLALWTEHLSHVHNCDCEGWEAIGFLITAARDYAATLPTAEAESDLRVVATKALEWFAGFPHEQGSNAGTFEMGTANELYLELTAALTTLSTAAREEGDGWDEAIAIAKKVAWTTQNHDIGAHDIEECSTCAAGLQASQVIAALETARTAAKRGEKGQGSCR